MDNSNSVPLPAMMSAGVGGPVGGGGDGGHLGAEETVHDSFPAFMFPQDDIFSMDSSSAAFFDLNACLPSTPAPSLPPAGFFDLNSRLTSLPSTPAPAPPPPALFDLNAYLPSTPAPASYDLNVVLPSPSTPAPTLRGFYNDNPIDVDPAQFMGAPQAAPPPPQFVGAPQQQQQPTAAEGQDEGTFLLTQQAPPPASPAAGTLGWQDDEEEMKENMDDDDASFMVAVTASPDNAAAGGATTGGGDGETSRGNKRKGTMPERKLTAERRRRMNLNDSLLTLRSSVPRISKMDRASIIGDAVEYMNELIQRVSVLQVQVETEAAATRPTRQTSYLPALNVQHPTVEVAMSAGQGVSIHMSCARKPGITQTTMRALDTLGVDTEEAVISCFDDFKIDVYKARQQLGRGDNGFWAEQIKALLMHCARL